MIDPDGYQLWGVTRNTDENGDYYESREVVLSFEPDDAGDIDMRISEAEPMWTAETIQHVIKETVQEEMDDKNNSAELIGRLMEKFSDTDEVNDE